MFAISATGIKNTVSWIQPFLGDTFEHALTFRLNASFAVPNTEAASTRAAKKKFVKDYDNKSK